jgi:hypothetical protein
MCYLAIVELGIEFEMGSRFVHRVHSFRAAEKRITNSNRVPALRRDEGQRQLRTRSQTFPRKACTPFFVSDKFLTKQPNRFVLCSVRMLFVKSP